MSAALQKPQDVRADADAAVREWAPLAYWIARDFNFPGADRQDVKQEALIGLWAGLRSHDRARVPLKPWLSIVIRKHLADRLRTHRRLKHRPLNEAASLTEPEARTGTVPRRAAEGLDAHSAHGLGGTPPGSVSDVLAPLDPFERRAVVGVAIGMTYAELGDSKAVDNALQRARKKLRAETGFLAAPPVSCSHTGTDQ